MKQHFLKGVLLAAALLPLTASAGPYDLLPKPHSMEITAGQSFALGRAVSVTDAFGTPFLRTALEEMGCTITEGAAATVEVKRVAVIAGTYNHSVAYMPNETYTLTVTSDKITIEAVTQTGVIRAAQTLLQLASGTNDNGGTASLQGVVITDWPAFKVRGFMHDVGRSFIPFDELKHEIDMLSRFKVNVFHWHLTEKLAWRFEVKAYPQLTASANMTRYAGSYYTQEQCKELEAYAAERGVTVIPEIDMPGHSDAFTKAMGFSMQSDNGVAALKKILDEVVATFPLAPYIHIGGDEVTITYPSFLQTMADYVRGKGKKVVMWNRLVAGPPTSSLCDMTQMWATAGRVVSGLPNIDCRYNYTNHFDVYADLVGIYKSNIYYAQQGTSDVAGTISAAWNDTKTKTWTDIVKQNNIYANIIASAERAWYGGGKQYIETGGTTLPNSGEEFEEFADFERRFLFHKAHVLKNEPIPYVKQTNVRWRITDPFPNNGNKTMQFPPETTNEGEDGVLPTSFTYNGTTYGSKVATGAGIYLRHIWHSTVPSFFSNPAYGQTVYAWTYVYSPVAQTAGAQVEFYTYSRSGNETAPPAGEWDRRGSKLWVNGTEIAAPSWEQPNASIPQDHATSGLTNENLTARPVVQIQLKQGWNKVLMRLPHAAASGTGRDKWQFTFVLTDTEGKNALDGIVYSPSKAMDSSTEQIDLLLGDIAAYIGANFSDKVGYYPLSLCQELSEMADLVRSTLGQSLSESDRAAQAARLNTAFEALKNKVKTASINQPKATTASETHLYTLCTPLRESRYVTSQGSGQQLIGQTAASTAALWKFEERTDGTFNIVSSQEGLYISPNSSKNTALTTVAAIPESGWTIKPADEVGYVIITSGTAEFNQTTSPNGYKIFNWGDGTNTTDTGCKYRIEEVEMPQVSNDQTYYWYTMCTPLRFSRYATGKGAGEALVGETEATLASQWKLTARTDGSYNIICRADGTFVSPNSANNTALRTVADEPSAGWSISPAATLGYYIITSGTAQFNQTNNATLNWNVYNWGNGTNTSDTGCQYLFALAEKEEQVPSGIASTAFGQPKQTTVYDIAGRRVANPGKGVYIVNGKKQILN